MDKTDVQELDALRSVINRHCEEMIYHPFSEYRDSGCRILNATRVFYYNILHILRKQTSENNISLTLEQNFDMLKQIKKILDITDTVQAKEQMITKLLEKENLNPKEFLYLDEWISKGELDILFS